MINEVLPMLGKEGLDNLEANFNQFLEAITQKAVQTDVTWQSILRCFLFHPEAQRIVAYLNEQGTDLAVEKRREVRLALQMNECQFD